MRWVGHVACMGEIRREHKILIGKCQRQRPLERSRSRSENNIKMNLKETGCEGMYWIQMAQDTA
jgi:hypothetical protein